MIAVAALQEVKMTALLIMKKTPKDWTGPRLRLAVSQRAGLVPTARRIGVHVLQHRLYHCRAGLGLRAHRRPVAAEVHVVASSPLLILTLAVQIRAGSMRQLETPV